MQYFNLTPHSIDIYPTEAFADLSRGAATGVDKSAAIMCIPSEGVARIGMKTEKLADGHGGVPLDKTVYEGLIGLPEWMENGTPDPDDLIIVSMPTQAYAHSISHPLANQMVIPSGAVRDSSNGSTVLGCQGLSFYEKQV